MAKRKQQEEPQGPGISGLFNVPPTYFLPGTIGDVGAVAIDYPTMRAEPWNQTAAPIPTPSSPQGEILAAPPGADAPSQFATGQQWKDLYDLMATETDVYRKYLQDTHQLAGDYFPPIVATNQVPSNLASASAWYSPTQKKVFLPLMKGGYEAGQYMDVGPTVRRTALGGSQEYTPVITSARNPKVSINMDMSPLPHEIGHYYDMTGSEVGPDSQMSWPTQGPGIGTGAWDYILGNVAGNIRPEQAPLGKGQSWFHAHKPDLDIPAEMFAEYFAKAMRSGVGLDYERLSKMYGGKSPVSFQAEDPVPAETLTPSQKLERQRSIDKALKSASTEADVLAEKAKTLDKLGFTQWEGWPYIFDAVSRVAENAPSPETQQAMQPALTEEAKNFLYWLFTRGYNPR